MLVPVANLGEFGVVYDLPASLVPVNGWTDARNMAFKNGYAHKAYGHSVLSFTPSVSPYALFSTPSGATNLWAYFGLAKAFAFTRSGPAETDITRVAGDYTGVNSDLWNGGMFQGLAVFNNGVDVPQLWSPVSTSQALVDLTNWPAGVTAKVVKGFKNYLIALNVTKTGPVNYPRMVKWSHAAAPGTVPSSWDEADATKDAGEQVLSEGEDALVDCCQLGDYNILYTKSQTWAQSLSGTSSIFNFNKRFDTIGLLAQECAKPFKRQHFVVTQDDVVVHDLNNVESVVDARMRDRIFGLLGAAVGGVAQTRVVPCYRTSEMAILIPYADSPYASVMAAVWNWKYNTWALRSVPSVRAAAAAAPGISALYELEWPLFGSLGAGGNKLFHDTGILANGVNQRSYVERTGLGLAGMDRDGKYLVNGHPKELRAIWPDIEGDAGTVISVYAAAHDLPNATPTWGDPVSFTLATDSKVDIYRTGKYLAIRYEETSNKNWKLKGHQLDVVPLGLL